MSQLLIFMAAEYLPPTGSKENEQKAMNCAYKLFAPALVIAHASLWPNVEAM